MSNNIAETQMHYCSQEIPGTGGKYVVLCWPTMGSGLVEAIALADNATVGNNLRYQFEVARDRAIYAERKYVELTTVVIGQSLSTSPKPTKLTSTPKRKKRKLNEND